MVYPTGRWRESRSWNDPFVAYGRLPYVNNVDRHLSSAAYADDNNHHNPSKFCRRCSIKMPYNDELKKFFCIYCGFNLTKEDLEELKPKSDNNNSSRKKQKPKMEGGKTDDGKPDEDVFVVSQGTRTQELADRRRQREFPGLDDDLHKLLVKSNATLVKSEEHLPDVGKETISNEGLDKQRESRNKFQNRYWTWH
ncbi:MAG: hypothetical protein M3275_09150 [Thermoproteota archaeon]|nr:hypothetical protein [Thermoproteota archaeon]